ncbi:MAG: OprO/OprP family phosphate-selective porin [Myxococcales bacterium]|nr:OprO/OprP family phosphate-selective porin [Myxococcales bacterium]
MIATALAVLIAQAEGYTPPAGSEPALHLSGYVDLGWAKAGGNGTSFSSGDTRLPADYGVDTFAPAVNSRGDVASTDSGGRFTNGFLPHSTGIGGHASFLVNTVDVDVRYSPATAPLMLFTRLQLLPRFSSDGESTRVLAEQAFARVIPFNSQEFALSVGKFDSVFGIEYLENEANLRTGVTPSLIARYTTGQSLGAKAFYRLQIAPLWTAVSLNVAATNGGTLVEPLAPQNASLTGTPSFSARFGIEVNLPTLELKVGASALDGPRNDQSQPGVRQKALGVDGRLVFGPVELRGEVIGLTQDEGAGDKVNGTGTHTVVSKFDVRGGYGQLAIGLDFTGAVRRIAVYGRYDRRHARFEGFIPITVDRITAGARIDVWETLAVKGEYLVNRELAGAPDVDNDVLTSSLVYTW